VRLMDRGLARRHGESFGNHAHRGQREECNDFGKLGSRGSTGMMDDRIIFLGGGGSAYALRGYGVTLGSSSSHDPFFSRAAA
jgi:hypothetical protein